MCSNKDDSKSYEYPFQDGTIQLSSPSKNVVRLIFYKDTIKKDDNLIIDPDFIPEYTQITKVKNEECTSFYFSEQNYHIEIGKSIQLFANSNNFDCSFFNSKAIANSDLLTSSNPITAIKGFELKDKIVQKYRKNSQQIFTQITTIDGERTVAEHLEKFNDRNAYEFEIKFDLMDDEYIYGLGSDEENIFNHRGKTQYLVQANMKIPMPVFISSNKYACLFNHGCNMIVKDDKNGLNVWGDCADQIDLFYVLGNTFDEIVSGIRKLTGKATMLPKWAFGYWQSKEHYKSSTELIAVVREYRKRNIPIDCIVQDWRYWPEGQWGQKSFDSCRYPVNSGFVNVLHQMNVKIMISIWPNMTNCPNQEEMEAKNLLLLDNSTYDAFNPVARKLFWQQANNGLYCHGLDAWWCDSTEPFCDIEWGGTKKLISKARFALLNHHACKYIDPTKANLYALYNSKAIYDGQKKIAPQKRVVNLTRSGYIGQQRYGSIVWTGDVSARWSVLQSNITNMINFSLTGNPYITFDIGGFFVGNLKCFKERTGNKDLTNPWFWNGDYEEGVNDLGYRELYTRWLQVGTFMPVFRSHGGDTPREIWQFGDETSMFYQSILKFIRLRYKFMPYLYSIAAQVHFNNKTFMRPLFFDFPMDKNVKNISNQYLFGHNLMVCAVTKPMYYKANSITIKHSSFKIEVYLPKGLKWYDFWTNEKYDGGQFIESVATIDRIPLFIKEGSIIPMCLDKVINAVDCKNTTLFIYPGKDGEFVFYDDKGDGDFVKENLTEILWDNKNQKAKSVIPFDYVVVE